jgi:hypothetical protein
MERAPSPGPWWKMANALPLRNRDDISDTALRLYRMMMEERERCAKIADAHVAQHDNCHDYPPGLRQALQLEGRSIAEAIRKKE